MVRRVVTMVLVVSIAAAVYVHRTDLRAALHNMGALSPGWVVMLLVVFALGMVAQGLVLQAVTPGLTLRQSWMVQESATAATNTIIGSGPVSTGVRIAMLRRWQIADRAVAISIVAQNVIAAFAVWTVALVTALAGASGATSKVVDHRVFLGVSIAAAAMLTGSTGCRPVSATRWSGRHRDWPGHPPDSLRRSRSRRVGRRTHLQGAHLRTADIHRWSLPRLVALAQQKRPHG